MPRVGNRILQSGALEPLVGDTGPAGRDLRDLAHHLRRGAERGLETEAIRQIDENLEIASRVAGRRHRAMADLNAPLRVDERAGLLREARAWQHDVGVARGLREK